MKYNIIAQIEARAKEGKKKKNKSGSKFEPKMKLKMHTVITHKMSHKFGSESPEGKHNLVLSTLFTMSKRKRRSQLLRSI